MAELERVSVSIERELLERFDELISEAGHTNRSEAVRDLIRSRLMEQDIASKAARVVASVTLLYDHHRRELGERLRYVGHEHHDVIVSSMHVHLDHDNCLEVLVVKGKSGVVRKLADALISTKGVKHGRLTITSSGASV